MNGFTKLASVLVIIFISAVFFPTGCAFKEIEHGTEISGEKVQQIVVDGKTTKEEILIEFGDPSKTMNNEKAFFYTWTRGAKQSCLGIGSGTAFTHSLVIIFDENGVVKSHKITRGTTQAATGIGD